MKFLLAVLLLFCAPGIAFAQNISPDPLTSNAICPNSNYTFTVTNIPSGCTPYTMKLVGGSVNGTGGFTFNPQNNTFVVNATNTSQKIRVKFESNGCSEKTFEIPVISVAGQAPTLSNCPGSLVVGRSATFIMSASLLYSNRGAADPAEVASYSWAFTSGGAGWTITTGNAMNTDGSTIFGKFATFTTDMVNSATIRVTATDRCGNVSAATTCIVTRFVETPVITGAPPFVVCQETAPINLTAVQPTSGLTGYSYSWTFGSWAGTSSGTSATVTPNGTTAGNIQVVATAFGMSSAPGVANIPLEVIHPNRMVQGANLVCPDIASQFALDQPLPPSSNVTWAATPSSFVTPSSGSGVTASVAGTPGSNGFAKMTFTVNNVCGTAERKKDFYVGTPLAGEIFINGLSGPFNWLCPNDIYYISYTSPSVGNILAPEQYEWVIDGGLTILSGQGTPNITVASPSIGSGIFYETFNGVIRLIVSNDCGRTVVEAPFTIRDCGGLGNPALVINPHSEDDALTAPVVDAMDGEGECGDGLDCFTTIPDITIHNQAISTLLPPGQNFPENSIIRVSGTLTVDQSTAFNGIQFEMVANSRIVVTGAGVVLAIGNSMSGNQTTFRGCERMWQGFLINNGARFDFRYARIEDARIAINLSLSADDDNSILFRNYFVDCLTGLLVGPTTNGNTFALAKFSGNYFEIGTGAGSGLLCPPTFTQSNGGQFPLRGLHFIQTSAVLDYGSYDLPNLLNVVKKHRYGMFAFESKVSIKNVRFDNMLDDPVATDPNDGVGIMANGSQIDYHGNFATSGFNDFEGMGNMGIYSINTRSLGVKNAGFRGARNYEIQATPSGNEAAINVVENKFLVTNPYLISAIRIERPTGSLPILIDNNIVDVDLSVTHVKQEKFLIDVIGNLPAYGYCDIINNHISLLKPQNKVNGIRIQNQGDNYRVEGNYLNYNPSVSNNPDYLSQGITAQNLTGCGHFISNNHLVSTLSGGNSQLRAAIHLQNNSCTVFVCENSMVNTKYGIRTDGSMPQTFLKTNDFGSANIGLYCLGTTVLPHQNYFENKWTGTYSSSHGARFEGTNPAFNFRVVLTNPGHFPPNPSPAGWFLTGTGSDPSCGIINNGLTQDDYSERTEAPLTQDEIVMTPNPAHTRLQLTFPAESTGQWMVFDLMGRLVQEGNWTGGGAQTLDVASWAPGLYTLQYKLQDGLGASKKLVITR